MSGSDRFGLGLGFGRGGPSGAGRDRLGALGRRLGRAAFGDRVGIALFVGALCFFALFWRVETLSNDNFANLNALVSLADGVLVNGHPHVARPAFGPSDGETPGMRYVDGRRVADNYGLVLLSLPALLAFRAAALVVDPGVAFAAVWSFGLLLFALLVGESVGRGRAARLGGSAVALVAFLANVALGAPLPARWLPLIALQLTTAVAAALTAVVCYRLGCRLRDRRVGVAAGVATAAATPVGFWAVGPKQHAVTALLVTAALYAFYRSRAAPTLRGETAFRALAYAAVGLTAWQHAGEALLLALALGPVDLATARRNRGPQLAAVALALVVAALPALATNALVAGDPLQPLKLLPAYRGQELVGVEPAAGGGADAATASADAAAGADAADGSESAPAGADGSATGSEEGGGGTDAPATDGGSGAGGGGADGNGDGDGTAGSGAFGALSAVLGAVASVVSTLAGLVERGLATVAGRAERSLSALTDPGRVRIVFLRSGYVPAVRAGEDAAINLSVLESTPLLGALAALPVVALRRLSSRHPRRTDGGTASRPWLRPGTIRRRLAGPCRPERAADALAVAYALVLVATVFDRLPVHHMLTVRYLHALYPLGIYGLVRSGTVRDAVVHRPRRLGGTYLAAVVAGTVLYAAAAAVLRPSLGESVQLYAVVAALLGSAVAGWAVLEAVTRHEADRFRLVGSVLLAVAAAWTTTYLLAGAGLFSTTGRLLLPLSRLLFHVPFSVP